MIENQMTLPRDFILILSGVSCVGKTTTAYNLINKVPQLKRVSEVDMLRSVLRTMVKEISKNLDEYNSEKLLKAYAPLFNSITSGNIETMKLQSRTLLNSIRDIVLRQQRRKIPTIIEGVSLVPSTFFDNNKPLYGFDNNVLFINLYISSENDHLKRRVNRCNEREYLDSIDETKSRITTMRKDKNKQLHNETLLLSKMHSNVYSLDISNLDQDEVIRKIQDSITLYLE